MKIQFNTDIVPTAGSCGVAKDRMETKEQGVTCYDWFFCTKELSLDQVNNPAKIK